MTLDHLRALARAIEPLASASGGFGNQGKVTAYNDLVSRFRQRVTLAITRASQGEPYEPDLTDELQLIAKALPEARRVAEAVKDDLPVTAE